LTFAKNFENCFGHSKYLCRQTPWRQILSHPVQCVYIIKLLGATIG